MDNSHEETLGRKFLKRCEVSSKHPAVGYIKNDEIKFITYEEYKNIVEQISLGLLKAGIRPGSKACILAHTCKEWNFSDLAILCARGVSVPVYPNYLSEEIKFILEHSDANILFIENDKQFEKTAPFLNDLEKLTLIISFNKIKEELVKKIPSHINFYHFDDFLKLGKAEKEAHPNLFEKTINAAPSNEVASIIYTSGTTGLPKGAVITHEAFCQMLNNIASFSQGAFTSEDRTLTFLPLSHVFGRVDSLMPLIFGWQMVFAESMEKVIDNITLVKPTIMAAVPRIFEKLYSKVYAQIEKSNVVKKSMFNWALKVSNNYYNEIQKDVSPSTLQILEHNIAYKLVFSKIYEKFGGKIRYFISGGAPLSAELMEFLRCCNLTVLEGYGLTETVAPCTLNPLSKQYPGMVGVPIGDVKISFATDGEILVQSVALFSGYYKNPEASAEAIKNGWFHTGDIGEFTKDGQLKITDRKKDLIITSAGKNIAPQKIENLMKMHPLISHFVVIGDKRKYLTAIVGIEKATFLDKLSELGLNKNSTISDIANNKKVNDLINEGINSINKKLASFETIKKFFIAPEEFSVDGGHLTPSLKIKRKVINERFKDNIDLMY